MLRCCSLAHQSWRGGGTAPATPASVGRSSHHRRNAAIDAAASQHVAQHVPWDSKTTVVAALKADLIVIFNKEPENRGCEKCAVSQCRAAPLKCALRHESEQ
jgi:hypothetical protein